MKIFFYTLVILFWSQFSQAADLVQVYCQALKCDPTFNAAMADLFANRENIPINRALLLPRLDIHADVERQVIKLEGISFRDFATTNVFIPTVDKVTFYNNSVNYCLKLSQPIFNYTNWAKLEQAKSTVKQAEATFCAAAQDLIVRVTRAYFDILIADANLFYTREFKKAAAEQLRQARAQFKVGFVAMTNVYEAQAGYDVVVAQEVADRYELARRVEALRAMTNNLYCDLQGLRAYLPLITPNPCSINGWVCAAEKQNYRLFAARYAALAAKEEIQVQQGGNMPVINAFGEYKYNYNTNFQGSDVLQRLNTGEAGLELDWAPYQGGGIMARTRQAAYFYQQAFHEQELTHRQVLADTRNAFLGIFSFIAKIRADHASVLSNQESVRVTTDGFRAGTRTILDVLNTQTQFYNAQKTYIRDRYEYIYQTILLKEAAGTLSVCDLQHINVWLYGHVNLAPIDAILDGCSCAKTK